MNDLAAGWEEAWELTVVVGDVLGGNSLGSFIFSNSPLLVRDVLGGNSLGSFIFSNSGL